MRCVTKRITYCNAVLALILFFLSTLVIGVNLWCFHFIGNNYFPPGTPVFVVILCLMYVGFILQYGHQSAWVLFIRDVLYFFLIMGLIAYATNAVQLTPFTPIDYSIVKFEGLLHLHLDNIVAWMQLHPVIKHTLTWVYDTLPYQMVFLPLLAMVLIHSQPQQIQKRRPFQRSHALISFLSAWLVRLCPSAFYYWEKRHTTKMPKNKKWSGHLLPAYPQERLCEYYFLILFSLLIGYFIYYFFPTIAPAYTFGGNNFSNYQLATGVKFFEIHHFLTPSTLEGGLISLPSFHVIWAWYGIYLVRGWRILSVLLVLLNVTLTFSCVLLGWHYPVDIMASIIIILLSHYFLNRIKNK